MNFYPETITDLYSSEPDHLDDNTFEPSDHLISYMLAKPKEVDQENIQALNLIDKQKEEEDEYNSALTSTLSHSNSISEEVNLDIGESPKPIPTPETNLSDD